MQNENLIATELLVDDVSIVHLRETSKWAKFIGIIGMIFSILIAMLGILLPVYLSSLPNRYGSRPYPGSYEMIGVGFASVFYVIVAALYFIISIFLFHFGAKMKKALLYTDQGLFHESLLNQKRYYRMTGIVIIISLSFLVLTILFALIGLMISR